MAPRNATPGYTGDSSDEVLGVLYGLERSERERLDRAEDLGRGYRIQTVRVETAAGTVEAFTYRALPVAIDEGLFPFDWYLAYLLVGARRHALPGAYIDWLAATATCADPDPERARLHWRLIGGTGR